MQSLPKLIKHTNINGSPIVSTNFVGYNENLKAFLFPSGKMEFLNIKDLKEIEKLFSEIENNSFIDLKKIKFHFSGINNSKNECVIRFSGVPGKVKYRLFFKSSLNSDDVIQLFTDNLFFIKNKAFSLFKKNFYDDDTNIDDSHLFIPTPIGKIKPLIEFPLQDIFDKVEEQIKKFKITPDKIVYGKTGKEKFILGLNYLNGEKFELKLQGPNGEDILLNSISPLIFYFIGTTCIYSGVEGKKFLLSQTKTGDYILSLISLNGGILNIDHHIPISLNNENININLEQIDNLKPCLADINVIKSARSEYDKNNLRPHTHLENSIFIEKNSEIFVKNVYNISTNEIFKNVDKKIILDESLVFLKNSTFFYCQTFGSSKNHNQELYWSKFLLDRGFSGILKDEKHFILFQK